MGIRDALGRRALDEADVEPQPLERFEELLPPRRFASFTEVMKRSGEALAGRTLWHVNATLKGGGVAEMLAALLPYKLAAGIDVRWVAIAGNEEFFTITKRIHNWLHGSKGDGGDLGRGEIETYSSTLASAAGTLLPQVRPGDVVFVHDPQTAGLIPDLADAGAVVIWHCHIGVDEPNELAKRGWRFLHDSVSPAARFIFSRADYLWDDLDESLLRVIPPSIDALSSKNVSLDPEVANAILQQAGLIEGRPSASTSYRKADGSTGTFSHQMKIEADAPIPREARIILQASRWDRLKDPRGVIEFFADHVAARTDEDVHLVIAGPSVGDVSDDPEGAEVVEECRSLRASLSPDTRRRVHLAQSPSVDEDEIAILVNALQRRADVVVQKSQAEGFGLVVSEAMWKRRPVVAAAVGGIRDQIEDGSSGILIDEPEDGAGFAGAVNALLEDPERAREMGKRAHQRVLDDFLTPRQLTQTMEMLAELV